MQRTIFNEDNSDFTEQNDELTLMVTNIHEIILKTKENSGISASPRLLGCSERLIHSLRNSTAAMWSCIQALSKIISSVSNKSYLVHRLRILPILMDLLDVSEAQNKIEIVLQMIQDITFGIQIGVLEPYLESIIYSVVNIITSEKIDVSCSYL